MKITASMLYDLIQCPHRVELDQFGDSRERDPANPFVQMLWDEGRRFEKELLESLGLRPVDVSASSEGEQEALTLAAMKQREPLISGALIRHEDLLGKPDLLRLEGDRYIAGDIKSGAGREGGEEGVEGSGKLKPHYAVQLALYTDILECKQLSAGRRAFVLDRHRKEVLYDFAEPLDKKKKNSPDHWDLYQETLAQAQRILNRQEKTTPAKCGECTLCHWNSHCQKKLESRDDLSLIFYLGRSERDALFPYFPTVKALAAAESLPDKIKGIKDKKFQKFRRRAQLLTGQVQGPYLLKKPDLPPQSDIEIFFDIETDPLRDLCYLHGFLERRTKDNNSERYIAFFAQEPNEEGERESFRQAFEYLMGHYPTPFYFYSPYERTTWQKLQQKYPEVCSREQLDELFPKFQKKDLFVKPSIDLYRIVLRCSEWPTQSYSVKTLARTLGFQWRDSHPSGADSIQWFDQWARERKPEQKQRILDYNEDDCRATRVVLDGLRGLGF